MRSRHLDDLELQRPLIRINQENVKNDLHGKRVLVTGAAGSIGSEIVRQIISYEPSLLILCDQAESPLHDIQLEIQDLFPDAPIEVVLLDVIMIGYINYLIRTVGTSCTMQPRINMFPWWRIIHSKPFP